MGAFVIGVGNRAILILAAAVLGGCTVIHIEGADHVTMVKPGVLRIEHSPGAPLVAYRASSVGLIAGRSGMTLGWSKEDAVLLFDPKRCQVVVFDTPNDAETTDFWRKLAGGRPDICVTGGPP